MCYNNEPDKPKREKKFKGMILDGKAYIAVKDQHYFRRCERCDVKE